MDQFGFEQLNAWLAHRVTLPVGPLLCVIDGSTRGRAWSATAARAELRHLAADAGVRRRFAPHQLRHAHAVEMAHEGAAGRDPAPARSRRSCDHVAGSGRGAVPALPLVRFLVTPAEPDLPISEHPALHRTRDRRSRHPDAAAVAGRVVARPVPVAGRVVARPVPVAAHGEGMLWPR